MSNNAGLKIRRCKTREELVEVIFEANNSLTPKALIKEKDHFKYLEEYLGVGGLNASYALLETDYVSKDYLSDYASYYALCFEKYEKVCTRIHLFHSDQDEGSFGAELKQVILEGKDHRHYRNLWIKNYLGFIVIKPIPNYFIGITLLRTYNYNVKKSPPYSRFREYWGTKTYRIHLFGNEIDFRHTLAFQEQDRNVSACATISIWSVLQQAAEDYYINLRSPSEITKDAAIIDPTANRLFPNSGLSAKSMAEVIAKYGLAPETRNLGQPDIEEANLYLKRLIWAYAPAKLPIILILKLDNESHAVSVCGYKLQDKTTKSTVLKKVITYFKGLDVSISHMYADQIEKLYVHDDHWGPFCRMSFVKKNNLTTPWIDFGLKRNCIIQTVIIPVYKKVRISFDEIEAKTILLSSWLSSSTWLFSEEIKQNNTRVSWDIRLYSSEQVKKDIQKNGVFDDTDPIDQDLQIKILSKSFPKYVWSVAISMNESRVCQFLYDSTALRDSPMIHSIIFYLPYMQQKIEYLLDSTENSEAVEKDVVAFFGISPHLFREKIIEFKTY